MYIGVLRSHNNLPMPLSASGASAKGALSTRPRERDPYEYQVGFGNFFASEAMYDMLSLAYNALIVRIQ